MPMLDFSTTWSIDELFTQATASVSEDTRWLVQSQSPGNLVLRREKGAPFWKGCLFTGAVIITAGIAFLLFPIFIPDLKNQQIVLNAKAEDGKTTGRITYTSGARKQISQFMQSMPRA